MGRPSLSEQRTREILEAFMRCVARQGLGGTSMQDIADEAGMKRPILRHYVGNRAELVSALAEYVADQYRAQLDAWIGALPTEGRLDALLKAFFPRTPASEADEILVLESLIAAAPDDETIRAPILAFVNHALSAIEQLVAAEAPQASKAERRAVAYGILSVWWNHSSLTPLRTPRSHRQAALDAARLLIDALS